MAAPDLAIDRNGNYVPDPSTGQPSIVVGDSRVKQILYIALVEMPPNQIISTQYRSEDEIERLLRDYLEDAVGFELPFPISQIEVNPVRNEDESISVSLEFPSVEQAEEDGTVDLRYESREGYQAQLDYIFDPDQTTLPQRVQEITEIYRTEKSVIRMPVSYIYSGQGPIRIYAQGATPQIGTSDIIITTEGTVRRYNLIESLDLEDQLIDTVQVLSGLDFIEARESVPGADPTLISYEDGTPYIYIQDDTPEGTAIVARLTYSNALSFANEVEAVDDTADDYVFGLKLDRSKYIARLEAPLDPGSYTVKYSAVIRYGGEFNR